MKKSFFTQNLMRWNKDANRREMPWKNEKDPYKIWLSEIILQQTRVEQGWNYYLRFIKTFPGISKLANSNEQKVFKLWEGLGYYSRCKNLIATAKLIEEQYAGRFPGDYDKLLALPGIGPYTAAAIASFAFNQPKAVVDGNVIRVLSRFKGIDVPADSLSGKKLFNELAQQFLDKENPGIYNQAIMDFGATVCKPRNPTCDICILRKRCNAFLTGRTNDLPVKEKKITKKIRWLYYFIMVYKGKVYIRKRTNKDIWHNLHEFVLIETKKAITPGNWLQVAGLKQLINPEYAIVSSTSRIYTQQLTHQTIHGQFIEIRLQIPLKANLGYDAIPLGKLHDYPLPKFMITYLEEKNVNLRNG